MDEWMGFSKIDTVRDGIGGKRKGALHEKHHTYFTLNRQSSR